jgi:carbonic anhydrase
MLANIQPAMDAVTGDYEDKSSKNAAYVQEVADRNVVLTVAKIKSDSPVLNEIYENGEIDIVGAMYDVHTGVVSFI